MGIEDMVCRPRAHRDMGKDNISSKCMTGETERETVKGMGKRKRETVRDGDVANASYGIVCIVGRANILEIEFA